MHFAIRTASRLPRPWIGQASTTARSTAARHSSNITPDEFVKQSVGEQHSQPKRKHDTKKRSSSAIRRVQVDQPWTPSMEKRAPFTPRPKNPIVRPVGVTPHLPIRRHKVRDTGTIKPWKLPAERWQGKPPKVFSRRSALHLRRLPLETTTKDIILSIDNAVREHKADERSTRVADILIMHRSDSSEGVDVAVDFIHPSGAQILHDLAAKGQFEVQGVVPEVSMGPFEDRSKTQQPSEDAGDVKIAQLSEQDREEYFAAPELRKIVRKTPLMYN